MTDWEARLAQRGYSLRMVTGDLNAPTAQAILRLWLENGVLSPVEAQRRLVEVVCVADDPTGELVGVNSVYLSAHPEANTFYWFYRMFIGPQRRGVFGLAQALLGKALAHLRDHPQAAQDMILVLENPKLMRRAPAAILGNFGFARIGADARGCEVWRLDFVTGPCDTKR